jgi:hypothetical protein
MIIIILLIITIIMGLQPYHFVVQTKKALKKATTLDTSRLTAKQLNTGWLFPLQPRHHCPRLTEVYPCDTDNDRGE